jgi:RHS repeat-associated protein
MKLTASVFLRITITLCSFLILTGRVKAQTNQVPDAIELSVLKNIYDSLGGASWTTKTNWPTSATWPASATSSQFGTWHGITVENGDIKEIRLHLNNLIGLLPSTISKLTPLTYLYLRTNQIQGGIPASYTKLSQLINMSLDGNQLTGSIPSDIGSLTNLKVLNLQNNQLTGTIPASIGSLINLRDLYLASNALTGEIPSSLGNLINLESLYMRINQLTGSLPSSMSNLTKLRYLFVSTNQLSGNLPPEFSALSSIIILDIAKNKFTGILPDFSLWKNLVELRLASNSFSGTFPSSVKECTSLTSITAENNFFTTIAPEILSLTLLNNCNFFNNELRSTPAFQNHVNKTNLTLNVSKNRLDFAQLESLYNQGIKSLIYSPMKELDETVFIQLSEGDTLEINGRAAGVNGTITWERWLDAGPAWASVNAINADASQKTFLRPNLLSTEDGRFRYKLTNSLFPSLVIQSVVIPVRIGSKMVWNNESGVEDLNDFVIRKTAVNGWDNAGAISENQLEANIDGKIEFSATPKSVESSYVVGFSLGSNTSLNRTDILNGIELTHDGTQRVLVYESSTTGIDVAAWFTGDIFTISREGAAIKYFRNGTLLRSVSTDASQVLKEKVVMNYGESPYSNASFWIPASRGTVPDAWEFKALKDLYDSLQGATWTRKNSWPTSTSRVINATAMQIDAWYGITVAGGDVTKVELQTNNLKGVLPASVSRLQKVNTLRLQSNQLSGKIPLSLGDMTALTMLNLGINSLTGPIPSSLGKLVNLTWLGLYSNPLTGTLNKKLFDLTNLENLYIFSTNIEGSIPSDIVKLTKIKILHLYQNKLSGKLPSSLYTLTSLNNLAISNNLTLSGTLPDSLGNLVNLTELWINGNTFSGQLPQTIGNLNKMKYLNMVSNKFSGEIPASIGNLTALEWAAFNKNQFSGSIPKGFGNMLLLDSLWLDNNLLTGSIPDTLKKAKSLVRLSLNNNQLEGALPASLSNLTLLRYLHLGSNKFTGTIPSTYSNLSALRLVDFSFTQLTGAIPLTMVSRTALKKMYFNDSKFTSFPNISSRTDKSTVTVTIQNNQIPISNIEANFTAVNVHGFAQFTYAQQINTVLQTVYTFPQGTDMNIETLDGGIHGTYLWERLIDGAWTDITSSNESSAPNIFLITNPSADRSGSYRYRIRNTWLPDLDIQSGTFDVQITDAVLTGTIKPLYNGIITAARWRTTKAFAVPGEDLKGMYVYDYDEKYQIKDGSWATYDDISFSYAGNQHRLTGMSYDANGNIQTLKRYNELGILVNDFNYSYEANKNKLTAIEGYTNAYTYNAVGQLIGEDKVEEGKDQYIEYDVTGKVVKVYSSAAKLAADLKIENLYDDRGFRLAKVNYETQRTTWYIRDASGNVISIYEQDGLPTPENSDKITEVEVPVYGSGKLGTAYPAQDGSVNYEITDHLGNVRALFRDNINIYTATMEDNGIQNENDPFANPRVKEMQFFENLFETEEENVFMNMSLPTDKELNPHRVALLHWNDNAGMQAVDKAVGPSIALKVNAGDKLTMEAWTRYEEKISYAKDFDLAFLSGLLGGTFVTKYGFEGFSVSQTTSSINAALTSSGFGNRDNTASHPFAYINYILYDQNMVPVGGNSKRIPLAAGSNQAELYINEPQFKPMKFGFDENESVVVSQAGYIYIWLSNESKDTRVWFDDLTITNTQNMVVQATDYGVWGDVIREQKSDESVYRYCYQGQFAERDVETGWSHFQLREYDPVIGRWMSTDPKGQYNSPYVGMGNNPVNGIDPDGGLSNPIYGSDGSFRGVDEFGLQNEFGLQGEGIIYDGEFANGMKQSEILSKGGVFMSKWTGGTDYASIKIWNHWAGLSFRPDWDGFVTIEEGIAWAKAHPNALANPTADNSLYINSGLLDFGNISVSSFDNLNTITPINLFNTGNTISSTTNPTLRATVYALGRVNMTLVHRENRQVTIVNDEATDYDWNGGGGTVRANFIRAERARADLNDSHGFRAFYYGVGTLRE